MARTLIVIQENHPNLQWYTHAEGYKMCIWKGSIITEDVDIVIAVEVPLHILGSLITKGDVTSRGSITTDGNIVVGGEITVNSDLTSHGQIIGKKGIRTDGNIYARAGIVSGRNIWAAGSITAKQGHIHANGGIRAGEAIFSSKHIVCKTRVFAGLNPYKDASCPCTIKCTSLLGGELGYGILILTQGGGENGL